MAGDSTGKARAGTKTSISTLLTFAIGCFVGFIASDRLAVLNGPGSNAGAPAKFVVAGVVQDRATLAPAAAVGGCGEFPEYMGEPRNELEAVLRNIAPTKEVLAAVANKNYLWGNPPMMETFTKGFKRAGVSNHLVLALDDETEAYCKTNGINVHKLVLVVHKSQEGTGENHAVSAMKFGILKQFMDIGYSVLLSDVDIVILQNPFDHLYRDSDVEGMTDGFDERTAYGSIEGFDDPSMGWARFAQFYKRFNMNSGLFYLRANNRTQELMARLDERLSRQKYWDQTAYNEEMFFLSHGNYKSPQVSVRVMDIDAFMNSKHLFKDVRNRPKVSQPPLPVTVHVNYHPDKHERMIAIVKYYVDGDENALKPFPGGSEPGQRRLRAI
ncbi:hypothetical protein FOA52_008753 [Chlamydomonas sp. UWO 241]|nr:hypothetical protein FOA52_008753 [Chlamydomonas sp. UWO 241]